MSEAAFQEAAERIKTLTKPLPNSDMLKLYSLFKQGTVGDCDTARPGFMDMKGRAKWDAWSGVKGKSKEDAQREYIALVEALMAANA